MARGRKKRVVENAKVEEVQPEKTNPKDPVIEISYWLSRKVGFENLDAGKKQFVLNKARKMISAGYAMKDGVPVQVVK